jgi:phosphate transport system protein
MPVGLDSMFRVQGSRLKVRLLSQRMTHYAQDLNGLKERLLTMAGHAENAVRRAVKALSERDDDLARAVQQDDVILDQFEKEIDETCIHLLTRAPLASDLRLITVAMKISGDLERVGDEATTISRRAMELNREPQLKHADVIPHMADTGMAMLKDALDAFVNRDAAKARGVVPRDKEVDRMNKQFHRDLETFMMERTDAIHQCLSLMVVSKSLERVADHATNIAEEVVYLYEAHDIRHTGKEPQVAAG